MKEHPHGSETDAPLSIRSIQPVDLHMPAIESARQRVSDEMENMVRTGLTDLVSLLHHLLRGMTDFTPLNLESRNARVFTANCS